MLQIQKKILGKAKDKAKGMLEEMMRTMTHEELLGEVRRLGEGSEPTNVKLAKKQLSKAEEQGKLAVKKIEQAAESGGDKKTISKKISEAKDAAKKSQLAEKKAKQELESAKDEAAKIKAENDRKAQLERVAKVKASLKPVLEKKQLLDAKAKAATNSAEDQKKMLSVISSKEEAIRKATQKRVEKLLKQRWPKKVKELNLQIVDCGKPHKTLVDQLRAQIATLKKEKAMMSLSASPPPKLETDPALKAEIEQNVKEATKAEFDKKLSAAKTEMQQTMNKQLEKEQKLLKKEAARVEAKDTKAQDKLLKAKAKEATASGHAKEPLPN